MVDEEQNHKLGVVNGQLAPCPSSPNCVSTQTDQRRKRMPPIPMIHDLAKEKKRVKSFMETYKNCTLIEEKIDYLRYEFRSSFFKFIDDVEFYFSLDEKVIHFRSASRVGYSDLGENRNRMSKIARILRAGRH